jgi:Flp pilus assembly protein TadB
VDVAHHPERGMIAVLAGGAAALVVVHLTGRHLPRDLPAWRPPPPSATGGKVAIGVVLVVAGAVAPPVPLVAVVLWWAAQRSRARRTWRVEARRVRAALPDLVDLLLLASTAGLSLPVAHPVVARHLPPPVGPRLLAADEAARLGRARADALIEALAPLGERARALADVLVDHLRYGVPLVPALERTSLELRLDRRRAAELEARRVPVRLLAPLVACVLPAFALLTVVPLLAASLEALPT